MYGEQRREKTGPAKNRPRPARRQARRQLDAMIDVWRQDAIPGRRRLRPGENRGNMIRVALIREWLNVEIHMPQRCRDRGIQQQDEDRLADSGNHDVARNVPVSLLPSTTATRRTAFATNTMPSALYGP